MVLYCRQNCAYVTGSRYIIHFYCFAVEASFYSDVVVFACRSSNLGSIPAGTGKVFSLYNNGTQQCLIKFLIFAQFYLLRCVFTDSTKLHRFDDMPCDTFLLNIVLNVLD